MKRLSLYAACLLTSAVGFSTMAAASSSASGHLIDPTQQRQAQISERADLAERLVLKWGAHVQEDYRMPVRQWTKEMMPVFKNVDIARMRQAALAKDFDSMNDALLQNNAAQNQMALVNGPKTSKLLGETANDLVFVPVTPCRIIDTRVAGGVIAANTSRDFDVTAISNYTFQGGDATNCGGVGAAGSFAAAAINFTVVTPSAAGFITAYPFNTTQPLAATVNYTAGDIRGNLAIVKLDQGASVNEMSVYSFAQTHLVADIVGYYINPQATALECIELESAGGNISAGSFGTQSTANCTAGYTITGGGCSMSTFDGRVVTSRLIVTGSSQSQFCAFRNEGTAVIEGKAYARCCRTPGR
jgi:hypothetical protein